MSCSVRIDGETGVISLLSQPPGDSNIRYEVELVATDGGGKSTTATLVVNFKKEFPNAPKFDSHIYNATVYENRTRFNNEPVRVRVCIIAFYDRFLPSHLCSELNDLFQEME